MSPLTGSRAMFKSAVTAGLAAGRSVLFPPTCLGCRQLVERNGTLCGGCWRGLRFLERPWCDVLGTPFPHDHGDAAVSPDAIANPPPFARARAAVAYSGLARRLVQSLKYRDRTDLAPWMAGWMSRAGLELRERADVIVPVPLHWRRFVSRRFNQSAELGRCLSGIWQLPFEPRLAVRARSTRQQVGLTANARIENVRGAFRVDPAFGGQVRGWRVLVVDDVYTTGATVAALARTLKRAGAAEVNVLTFARVVPDVDDGQPWDFDGPQTASI